MPFTEPFRPQDQIDTIRKVGRLAQIILDLRLDYERRPRRDLLDQILARISELDELRAQIVAASAPKQESEDQAISA